MTNKEYVIANLGKEITIDKDDTLVKCMIVGYNKSIDCMLCSSPSNSFGWLLIDCNFPLIQHIKIHSPLNVTYWYVSIEDIHNEAIEAHTHTSPYNVYQFSYRNKELLIIAANNIANAYELANKLTNNDNVICSGKLDCVYDCVTAEKAICLLDRYV